MGDTPVAAHACDWIVSLGPAGELVKSFVPQCTMFTYGACFCNAHYCQVTLGWVDAENPASGEGSGVWVVGMIVLLPYLKSNTRFPP